MTSARICLQWTLILFDTLSIIIGITGIVCGVFQLQKCLDGTANCPDQITQIVVVSMLVISAIVGCCGSVNGSIKTLCAYLIILFLMMATHGWLLWRYDEPNQMRLVDNMVTEVWIAEVVESGAMAKLQQKYECCGKYGFMDYTSGNGNISRSCFHPNTVLNNNPYTQGCIIAVKKSYLYFYRIEYWTHVALICFEGFGALLTTVLIWKLMAKTRRYHY